MRFKPILLFCALPLMLLLSTCKDEDVLPAATQNGSNTIGCKVNGKVWLPNSDDGRNLFVLYDSDSSFYVDAFSQRGNVPSTRLELYILNLTSIGVYPIEDNPNSETAPYAQTSLSVRVSSCFYAPFSWAGYELIDGSYTITKYDMTNSIIAGTFEATFFTEGCDTLRITEGRFDFNVR